MFFFVVLYYFPMTIITLIIAACSYRPWTKWKSIYAGIMTIAIVLSWAVAFHNPNASTSNARIGQDIVSAKEIVNIVEQEFKNNSLSAEYDLEVFSLSMNLNKEQKGLITILAVDEAKHTYFRCEINTRKNGKIEINKQSGYSTTYISEIFNINEWIVDSTDAIRIAQEHIGEAINQPEYDQICLNEIRRPSDSEEETEVLQVLFGSALGSSAVQYIIVIINPYTGEILETIYE